MNYDPMKYDPKIGKNAEPMTAACECEHIDHCFGPEEIPHVHDDAHAYGDEFDIEDLTELRTEFGTFTVCAKCAETCLKDWA